MNSAIFQRPDYRSGPPIIDPRDYRVNISNSYFIERIKNQNEEHKFDTIRQWLVQVYESVTSDAFLKYHEGKLSQNEVKSYTAKNYMMNLTSFMKKLQQLPKAHQERTKIFEFIHDESNEIIKEVILKYPQADAKANVRKLKKTISRPDNRENDEYDLFIDSKKTTVEFKLKENKNYSSQIMRCLNYIMEVTNQPLHKMNIFQTNFDGFNMMLESIFTFAGSQQFETQFFSEAQNYLNAVQNHQNLQNKSDLFQALFIPSSKNKKQIIDKLELHKNNIKQECNFKINQKVSGDIKIFTQQEINAGLFRVPDSTVLRVMTKWAEELRIKLKDSHQFIQKRVELFKTTDGNFIELNSQQKKYLFQAAQEEEKRVADILKKLQSRFIEMAAILSTEDPQAFYANNSEAGVGIFAAKSQMCIGKYMFTYLNQLIHSLMIIPKRAKQMLLQQKPGEIEGAEKIQSVNLVTFKIGDLMRARCKGSQKHIIDVYKFLEMISQRFPTLLRIVRVKDRLDEKDNDILLNLFFMNRIQCQIQMMVTSHVDPKQEHLNSFNHLIYQLKRAQFGLIAQCACIMVQHDPVIKNYFQRQSLSPKTKIHTTKQPITRQDLIKQNKVNETEEESTYKNLPFFCSICQKFDSNHNPNFYSKRVSYEKVQQCSSCYEIYLSRDPKESLKLWLEQLLRERFKDQDEFKIIADNFEIVDVKKFKSVEQIYKINKALIISKKEDIPIPKYAQMVMFDSVVYIMTKDTNKGGFKSKIILKATPQDWKKVIKNIIILSLKAQSKFQIRSQKRQNDDIIKLVDKQKHQEKGVFLSYGFSAKEDSINQTNHQIIRQTYKKKKEIFNITEREFTNQLYSISKMESIKRIYGSYNKIRHLSFLEKMPNLTVIELNQNNISQLKELSYCKKLKSIRFSNENRQLPRNQIIQFSGIREISCLQIIEINKNNIKEISDISKLSSLTFLSLKQNEIQKIENLQGLISLRELYLNMNQISKIQNLENLKNLVVLELNGNKIQTMENLNSLSQLEVLKINSNHIKKIENIDKLSELKILTLDSSRISQMVGLQTLNKLQMLSLDYNPIQKIQKLHNLTHLKQIRLVAIRVSKIQNFEKLINIKLLYLDYNSIKKLQNLDQLVELECLSLIKNKINTIENLSKLKKLKILNLNLNQITTMKGLQQSPSLETVSLIDNKITKIESLQDLPLLKTIKIKKNPIKLQKDKQEAIAYFKKKKIEYQI